MEVEKLRYDEAKRWFWRRTWVWFLPGAAGSILMWFLFAKSIVRGSSAKLWLSILLGLTSELLGLLAGWASLQFPWMRFGWRLGFLLNGPACAVLSAICAFLCSGAALAYLQNDVLHPPSPSLMQSAYAVMQFGIAASALWGFIFGSWFVLRRDKYFVEPI